MQAVSKYRKGTGATAPGLPGVTVQERITHEVIYSWPEPCTLTLQCVSKAGETVGYMVCSGASAVAYGANIAAAVRSYNAKYGECFEGLSGYERPTLEMPTAIDGHDLPTAAYREVEIRRSLDGGPKWDMVIVDGPAYVNACELEADILDGLPVVPWYDLVGTDGDIRGRIRDEARLLRCFAWRTEPDDGELHYCGIVEVIGNE